jgi:hypothetical protein
VIVTEPSGAVAETVRVLVVVLLFFGMSECVKNGPLPKTFALSAVKSTRVPLIGASANVVAETSKVLPRFTVPEDNVKVFSGRRS